MKKKRKNKNIKKKNKKQKNLIKEGKKQKTNEIKTKNLI